MGRADFGHLKWQTEVRYGMVVEHVVDAIRDITHNEVVANDDVLRDVVNDYGLTTELPVPEFSPEALHTVQANQVMDRGNALENIELPTILHTVFSDLSKQLKAIISIQQERAVLLELMWKAMHSGYALQVREDMLDMLLDSWVTATKKLVDSVNTLAAELPLFHNKGQKVILATYRQWAPWAFPPVASNRV